MKQFDKEFFQMTYLTLDTQLRAAAECKASHLSTRIFNEIERRLLQRSQCQGFETFLLALILLNCVESMCFMYEVFGSEEHASTVSSPYRYADFKSLRSDACSGVFRCQLLTTPPKARPFPISSAFCSSYGAHHRRPKSVMTAF